MPPLPPGSSRAASGDDVPSAGVRSDGDETVETRPPKPPNPVDALAGAETMVAPAETVVRETLASAGTILAEGAGYERQRRLIAGGASLADLVDHLIDEMRGGRPA